MGIANTTAAACLICAFTDTLPEQIVGRGTGVDDAGLARKREVVTAALARARKAVGVAASPTAVAAVGAAVAGTVRATAADVATTRKMFAQLGGLEIAAMAGFYIEAARNGVPVLLDGYISGAAALAAVRLEPRAVHWMLASHRSAEGGHGYALQALGLDPLIDLGMRLGEGSGAMAAVPLVAMACAGITEVPTFGEWFG